MPDDGGLKPPRKPRKSTGRGRLRAVEDPPKVVELKPFPPQDVQPPMPPAEVEVIDPRKTAHQLRLSGLSWREVAERCGYASANNAIGAVDAYLQQAASEVSASQRREAFDLQLERYETLLHSWWEPATIGQVGEDGIRVRDEKAANVVLRVLQQIDKLHRLGEAEADSTTQRAIVIAGSPDEYIAGLRQFVQGSS